MKGEKEKELFSVSGQYHNVYSSPYTAILPLCVLVLISGGPFGDWLALTASSGGNGCDSAGVSCVGCQSPGCMHALCAQVGHVVVHPQFIVKQTSQGSQRRSPADVQLVSAEHHHCQSGRSMVQGISCADAHLCKRSSNVSQPHCTHT